MLPVMIPGFMLAGLREKYFIILNCGLEYFVHFVHSGTLRGSEQAPEVNKNWVGSV